jgi:hypothetical protein
MRLSLVAAVALLSSAIVSTRPSVAHAEEEMAVPIDAPRSSPRLVWYGWQNVVVGYAGATMAYGGASARSLPMLVIGGLVYLGGGAVVHGVHGNPGRAVGSVGILAAGAAAGGAIGGSVACAPPANHDDSGSRFACSIDHITTGAFVGMLIAPLIDGALGWEDVSRGIAVHPVTAIGVKDKNGVTTTTFGLGGVF